MIFFLNSFLNIRDKEIMTCRVWEFPLDRSCGSVHEQKHSGTSVALYLISRREKWEKRNCFLNKISFWQCRRVFCLLTSPLEATARHCYLQCKLQAVAFENLISLTEFWSFLESMIAFKLNQIDSICRPAAGD